jgi:hypothetical protein
VKRDIACIPGRRFSILPPPMSLSLIYAKDLTCFLRYGSIAGTTRASNIVKHSNTFPTLILFLRKMHGLGKFKFVPNVSKKKLPNLHNQKLTLIIQSSISGQIS